MNLRPFASVLFLITMAFSQFYSLGTINAFAQTPEPDPEITLKSLSSADMALTGPTDSMWLEFVFPGGWAVDGQTTLNLKMKFFGPNANGAAADINHTVGFLTVKVNGTYIDTVSFDRDGEYNQVLTIPSETWKTDLPNESQTLEFYLDDVRRCEMIQMAAVENGTVSGMMLQIDPESTLTFSHSVGDLALDFQLFPYPIYQETFFENTAVLALPTNPAQNELQAALTTASALGVLTDKQLDLKIVFANQLSPEMLEDQNIIFVGFPQNISSLEQAEWPLSYSQGEFSSSLIGEDDGILQMTTSPYNPSKVWLWVTGQNDVALLKAAQALGSQKIRPFDRPDLAVVTEVPSSSLFHNSAEFTLADLGYNAIRSVGFGKRYYNFWFYLPMDYAVSDGAYFDLIFNNASLVNYEETAISVALNDFLIGGVRLSDRSTNLTTFRISMPAAAFRAGGNRLMLYTNVESVSPCVDWEDVWISISDESRFNLPLSRTTDSSSDFRTLSDYTDRLFPSYSYLTFVLGDNDPDGWLFAAAIAYEMGDARRGLVINPNVVFSKGLTRTMRENTDLIIVGRASKLPILQDIASNMPAPFKRNTDIAQEPGGDVSYKVPSSIPVGYLEIFASPWNSRRTVMTVLGNGEDGLNAALRSLEKIQTVGGAGGNFAVVYENQLIIQSVKPEAVAEEQTQAQPELVPQVVGDKTQTANTIQINLVWLGISVTVIVVFLGIILWVVGGRIRRNSSR